MKFFALQVFKVAESLALPCALTLMAPHHAPIQQCSPPKPSTEQKSAPKQNTQEVSDINFNNLTETRKMMITWFSFTDALPYPTTDLWTFNVAVSGKVVIYIYTSLLYAMF